MFVRALPVLACLCLAPASPVAGQPEAAPPLTLEQVVDEALAANPGLLATRSERGVAAARPAIERYLTPPMLEGQVFQWPLDTANPANAQFMLTLQQELPGRGKRALRVTRAEREADKVEAAVAVRQRDVEADIKTAYLELVLARDVIASLSSSLELTDQMVAAAETRYASGRGAQQDVVKGLLERGRMEEEILMAREQEAMATARLNALRGRDPLLSVGGLARPIELPLPPPRVVQDAVSPEHPELRMASAETRAVEAEQAVVESEDRPDYVVQGGYMRMPSERDAWTARVGVTWPHAPWTRDRHFAMLREAEARRAAASANERAQASAIAMMVREAYVRAESAASRATLLRTRLVPRTDHALELAQLGYQNDQGEFADVIDATRARVALQRDLIRADGDRWLALVALERALGGSLGALVSTAGGRP